MSWPTPSPPTQVDSALAQAAAQQKEERLPSSRKDEDFLGSPGVKTLRFRCRVRRFDPWSGKFRMATVRGRGPPSKKKSGRMKLHPSLALPPSLLVWRF